MRYLIVVDDEEKTWRVKARYAALGIGPEESCVVATTASGADTLLKAAGGSAENVDCIFLDILLGKERTGWDELPHCRELFPGIPVIAFTNVDQVKEWIKFSAGMDGFLPKDAWSSDQFEAQDFIELVSMWRGKCGLDARAEGGRDADRQVVRPVVLHLSDVQFGNSVFTPVELANLVRTGCQHTPNVVVVSGDIAQSGAPEEYDLAQEFLERLLTGCQIPRRSWRRRLIVCPGNHDVNWNLSMGALAYDKDGEVIVRESPDRAGSWFGHRFAPFVAFRHALYGEAPWSAGAKATDFVRVHDLSEFGLAIAQVNTSSEEDSRQKRGCIAQDAFEELEEMMKELPGGCPTKLVVFHHPLQVGAAAGVEPNPRNVLRDPMKAANRLAGMGFSCALTGHAHARAIERIGLESGDASSTFVNLLAGSAAVPAGARPGDQKHGRLPNSFNVLRQDESGEFRLRSYEYHVARAAFFPMPVGDGFDHPLSL